MYYEDVFKQLYKKKIKYLLAGGSPENFKYSVTLGQIRKYLSVSTKDKLQWLEEAKEFFDKVASPETKENWQLFREGKI